MTAINWRLHWYRATHWLISKPTWVLIIGPDMSNTDYGVTIMCGPLPLVLPLDEWKRWRHEWRINVRWPVGVRHRSMTTRHREGE